MAHFGSGMARALRLATFHEALGQRTPTHGNGLAKFLGQGGAN
jgi:hypothetical protein